MNEIKKKFYKKELNFALKETSFLTFFFLNEMKFWFYRDFRTIFFMNMNRRIFHKINNISIYKTKLILLNDMVLNLRNI